MLAVEARRAKLVCTIGPASAERLDELVAAGMDVARLNLSHGTPAEHATTAMRVRESSPEVALLVDLPGPKVRLGELEHPEITLEPGASFALRASDQRPGNAQGAGAGYPSLGDDLRRGDRVLLADGAVELRVEATSVDGVVTEVVRGGTIRPHAGVSIPAERISLPALTDADHLGASRAVEIGADYVAQSFVRQASDVAELRALLGPDGPPIVAKIETRPAIEDFDAICAVADAVMIARGDLGVELPFEEVPLVQKQLVRRALDLGVPSIVATQMLESMVSAPRPTRAEASDVANAVFDGADAIMLSAETAIGSHPILAAEAAARIVAHSEAHGIAYQARVAPDARTSDASDARALAIAAVALAEAERDVTAIACYTRTGRTARMLSALRPRVPIVAYSPDAVVLRRLSLVHGVDPRGCAPAGEGHDRLDLMSGLVGEALPAGSAVVLVASTAAPGSGPNLLEVRRVGSRPS
jgi:pyruvate kinase